MTDSFGPYSVIQLVATGASGRVYRAQHSELGRVAAIKELSPELRGVPGVLERLRAEAELLSELSHPNIVDVYDYVEEPDRAWLAEEWVDGSSLQTILDSHGRLTPEQSLGVVRGALIGLAHAHDRGVVHRDVSTGNILADQQGTSMLVDFGLAAPAGAGAALGTPAFLSPEAARGEAVGKPGDVYSAAAVLFTLLAGHPPFDAAGAPAMARAHMEQAAPRLEGHGADLADLLERSMSKQPADRPADATAFLAELEEAARRRFGPEWLTRASIAGLVGAASLGAGAAAAGTGVGAAASGAAQTVVFDAARFGSSLPGSAAKVTKPARSLSKIGIVAGAGLVVVVGAVSTYALTSSGDDGAGADPAPGSTSSSTSPSPTTSVDPVVASAPDGVWVLRSQAIKSDNPKFAKVGSKAVTSTWNLKPSCDSAETCGGTVKSSSGKKFDYTWDGDTIVVAGDVRVYEGRCSADDGTKVAGTHFKEVQRYKPVRLVKQGKAFVGDFVVHATVSELEGDCVNAYLGSGAAQPTATFRWTVKPKN